MRWRKGDVLQIVVFSIFLRDRAWNDWRQGRDRSSAWCEALAETMFKFTNIVMHYAPIGVGAAIAYTVGAWRHWRAVQPGLARRRRSTARSPFSSSPCSFRSRSCSGPAAKVHPRGARNRRSLRFRRRRARPRCRGRWRRSSAWACRGASCPSCFRSATASISMARRCIFAGSRLRRAGRAACSLTIGQQITMLLTLMLTSKGVAGVPRASLVILAGTLASYGLPLEGVTLILGVDELMDMATNDDERDRQLSRDGRHRQVGRGVRRGDRSAARARGRAWGD